MDVRGSKGSLVAALATGIAAFAIAAPAASAAGYSVTGTGDSSSACTPSGSDFSCPTLRSAIDAVNTAGGTNAITLPAGTITLTGDQLAITGGDALTVQGAGPGKTIIDGNSASRIFQVNHGNFTVSGVTLQHGATTDESGNGGGIDDEVAGNSLTVQGSTFDHNTASGSGGSIYALTAHAVTVTDSTISNSTAGSNGGGIYAANLVMSGSTVNGNTATGGSGGGVLLTREVSICDVLPFLCSGFGGFGGFPRHVGTPVQGTVNPSISNSTIVGNSTGDGEGSGGGIALMPRTDLFTARVKAKLAHAAQLKPPADISGLVSLVGDTIVGNTSTAGSGGNISQPFELFFTTPVWIQGSIIGAGQADGPNNCQLTTYMFDGGNNLVFSTSTDDTCFLSNVFKPGNDILPGDPRLANGPGLETDSSGNFLLADNGGPTKTIALKPGSPAIDAVTSVPQELDAPVHALQANTTPDCIVDVSGLALATDQRGAGRPDVANTGCDIGAFESGAAPLVVTGSVTPNPTIGQPVTYSFTATNDGPSFGTHSTFHLTLPSGSTFDSATPSQGSCTQTDATTVDCTVGVIPDGTASVAVAVTPNSSGSYAMTATAADRESGSSLPLTLSATVNAAAKAGPTTAASIIAPKPSTQIHACVSRRDFPIHIQHLRRFGVVSATVYVNGAAVSTVHGKHMSAPIDLRELPKGTFTVTIVAHQRKGHVLRGKRTYHTCAGKTAGHKHLKL